MKYNPLEVYINAKLVENGYPGTGLLSYRIADRQSGKASFIAFNSLTLGQDWIERQYKRIMYPERHHSPAVERVQRLRLSRSMTEMMNSVRGQDCLRLEVRGNTVHDISDEASSLEGEDEEQLSWWMDGWLAFIDLVQQDIRRICKEVAGSCEKLTDQFSRQSKVIRSYETNRFCVKVKETPVLNTEAPEDEEEALLESMNRLEKDTSLRYVSIVVIVKLKHGAQTIAISNKGGMIVDCNDRWYQGSVRELARDAVTKARSRMASRSMQAAA